MGRKPCQKINEICPLAIHKWWKSIDIYWKYGPETKIWMGICKMGKQTEGHTYVQRVTIIPRHYHVAGYKKHISR